MTQCNQESFELRPLNQRQVISQFDGGEITTDAGTALARGREAHAEPPAEIVLDLDATDDPLHGNQEGRFFHGYYGHYCSLPLYIFSGDHLLCARLQPSNIGASAGCLKEVERTVGEIRRAWPEAKIILRGDAGFCREELMAWYEQHQMDYGLGLAKNQRLKAEITGELEAARQQYLETGKPVRVFKEFP